MEIKRSVLHSVFWNFLTTQADKIIELIQMIILARLLEPRDFGLVGIAWVVLRSITVFNGMGMSAALIYRKQMLDDDAATSVFWLNLGISLALFVICYLIAPMSAIFYKEQMVSPIIKVTSLTFLISSCSLVPTALLEKELQFKKKILPELLSAILSAIFTISMAFLGFGVWSLVAGAIIRKFVYSVSIFFVTSWRPKFKFNLLVAKEIFGYGSKLIGSSFTNFLIGNVDYAIIGHVLNMHFLGLYTFAYEKGTWAMSNVTSLISPILFPTLSKLQNDLEKLQQAYLKAIQYISIFTTPICFFIIATGYNLVSVVFGNKWLDAVPMIQVIAISGIINSICINIESIYKAQGKPGLLFNINLIRLILLIPTVYFTSLRDIFSVAVGVTILHIIFLPVKAFFAYRMIRLKMSQVIPKLLPQTISGLIMFFSIKLIEFLKFSPFDDLSFYNLIISLIIGIVLYVSCFLLLERNFVNEIKSNMKIIISKPQTIKL